MGVTQYIGSRYVPVFADPAEWNSTRTYEPLTIVMNEGNSYTSKQYVPKGIDISNGDYWAETGNYNAQVEQYRREVATFDGRLTAENNRAVAAEKANADAITAENNRAVAAEKVNADAISAETNRATAAEKVNADAIAKAQSSADKANTINSESWHLIIGDSWTQPADNTNHPGYTNWVRNIVANNARTKTYGVGGATFDGVLTQLDNAINDADFNNEQVSDIFMVCGVNVSYDAQPLIEGANKVADKVHANFKNARLIWAANGHNPLTDAYIMNLQATNSILQSSTLKCSFIPLTYYLNSPANYSHDENDNEFYGHKIDGFHLDDYSTGLMVSIYNNAINGTPQNRIMYNTKASRAETKLDAILRLKYIDTTEKNIDIAVSLDNVYEIYRDNKPSLCNVMFDLSQISSHTMNFVGYSLYISADTINYCTIPFGYRINNSAGGTYPAPFASCNSNFNRVAPDSINGKDYYKYLAGEFKVDEFKPYNLTLRF